MAHYTGIVLKTHFPKKKTITVLESHEGVMDYISPTEDICKGIMITYTIANHTRVSSLSSLERIGLPLCIAQHDLLFFHHILELCYHFVPRGSHMPEVFLLLKTLYIAEKDFTISLHKKIFLIRLFILFGIMPERDAHDFLPFYRENSGAVDRISDEAIILDREYEIDRWLEQCIKIHPYHEYFKTIHFLANK